MAGIWDNYVSPSSTGSDWDSYASGAPPVPDATEPPTPSPVGTFQRQLDMHDNVRLGAEQGTNPNVLHGDGKYLRPKLGPVTSYDDNNVPYFKDADGNEQPADMGKHVVLKDPLTGDMTVFQRVPEWDEGAANSAARLMTEGMLTGPVSKVATSPQVASYLDHLDQIGWQGVNDARYVPKVPPAVPGAAPSLVPGPSQTPWYNFWSGPTKAELATQRAQQAAQDLKAFKNMDVPAPGFAFQSGPVAWAARQLGDSWVGGPIRSALDTSIAATRDKMRAVAESLSPTETHQGAGVALQAGLNRFQNAGITDLEPAILERLGIDANAARQPAEQLSQGAATRAAQAAPLRQALGGGLAETSRGVAVPAARGLEQTLVARTGAEDMTNPQLAAFARMPSNLTSFAARQQALFEIANRQLPTMFKAQNNADITAAQAAVAAAKTPSETIAAQNALKAAQTRVAANNPLFATPNAGRIASGLMQQEKSARISGGVLEGRFGQLVSDLQNSKSGFTIPAMRAARTEVGRALGNLANTDARLDKSQLSALYGGLSRDLEGAYRDLANRAYQRTQLPPDHPAYLTPQVAQQADNALYKFRTAERYTRAGMERMERFKNIVGVDNPAQAAGKLLRAALEKDRGNINLLRTAKSALRPEEWNDIAGLAVRELGAPTAGAKGTAEELGFSVERAMTNFRKMDPTARNLLFSGEHAEALNNIERIVNRLGTVEDMANKTKSGVHAINVGALLAGGAEIASNPVVGIPRVLGAAATGFGAATLFANPLYAKWAVGYARARAALARAPQSGMGAIAGQVQKLQVLARNDPTLLPIAHAVAAENGVRHDADEQQPVPEQRR